MYRIIDINSYTHEWQINKIANLIYGYKLFYLVKNLLSSFTFFLYRALLVLSFNSWKIISSFYSLRFVYFSIKKIPNLEHKRSLLKLDPTYFQNKLITLIPIVIKSESFPILKHNIECNSKNLPESFIESCFLISFNFIKREESILIRDVRKKSVLFFNHTYSPFSNIFGINKNTITSNFYFKKNLKIEKEGLGTFSISFDSEFVRCFRNLLCINFANPISNLSNIFFSIRGILQGYISGLLEKLKGGCLVYIIMSKFLIDTDSLVNNSKSLIVRNFYDTLNKIKNSLHNFTYAILVA